MKTLLVGLALTALCGCGPKLQPQPSIAERCQAAPQPRTCEALGYMIEAEIARDEAQQQPVYQAQPTQRVFIHRWVVPGGRNNPAPIGYYDIY